MRLPMDDLTLPDLPDRYFSDGASHSWPFPVQDLADALGTDPEMLYAIAVGITPRCFLDVPAPFGGYYTPPSYEAYVARLADEEPVIVSRNGRPQIGPSEPKPADRYWVYRLIGANDRVLYVGLTRNLHGRMKAHRRRWGDTIVDVRTEEYDDHESALEAEAAAIHDEQPPFNHSGIG